MIVLIKVELFQEDYLIKVGAITRGKKIAEDNWWNLSQGGDCWKIVSNSNCELESQFGFLIEKWKINLGFRVVEWKTIPWCEGSLFLIKEVIYS